MYFLWQEQDRSAARLQDVKPDLEERLCDTIAAEILMPRGMFRAKLLHGGVNLRSVRHVAEEFQVSLEAATMRLCEIAEEGISVILWKEDDGGRLAVAWSRSSGETQHRSFLPRGYFAPLGSGPSQALEIDEVVENREILQPCGQAQLVESVRLSSRPKRVLSLIRSNNWKATTGLMR
jgi:hypothetical protein